jgi:hypothetical protein
MQTTGKEVIYENVSPANIIDKYHLYKAIEDLGSDGHSPRVLNIVSPKQNNPKSSPKMSPKLENDESLVTNFNPSFNILNPLVHKDFVYENKPNFDFNDSMNSLKEKNNTIPDIESINSVKIKESPINSPKNPKKNVVKGFYDNKATNFEEILGFQDPENR